MTDLNQMTVAVNGTRIAYTSGGSGPPVVLLHGWPQTGREWRHVAAGLTGRHTVIIPDLRGCGGSERASDGYEKTNQAEDIRALLHHLGHSRAAFVGHDIGGMVAFALAISHPEQVSSLVLIELLVPGFGLEQAMDVAQGGYWHFGLFMQPDVPDMLLAGREREFLSFWFARMSARPGAIGADDQDAYIEAYAGSASLRAGFGHYRTLLADGQENRGRKPRLSMPVLAIGAEHGVGDRLATSLKPISDNLRGIVFEGSGHYVAEEQPDRLVRELTAFLGE